MKKLSRYRVLLIKAVNDVLTVGILLARFGPTFVKYSLNWFAISTRPIISSLLWIKASGKMLADFFFINNFVNKSLCLMWVVLYCLKFRFVKSFFLVILYRWLSLFLYCLNLNLFSAVGVLIDFLYSLFFCF